jgi:hypothetical protein
MKRSFLIFTAASFLSTLLLAADKPFTYPQPPKSAQTDDYFGTKVADPYRDLENVDAVATKKWIEAENKLTFDYLATIPERKKINAVVEQVADDFARVKVTPENPGAADPAWVFLQKKDGKWTGVALGTSFTTEDYQQLGIPNALRIP